MKTKLYYEHSEDWYTLHKLMNVKTHENTLPEVEFHMLELPILKHSIEKNGRKPAGKLEELLCYFGSIGGEKLMEEIAEHNSDVEDLLALERVFRMDPWVVRSYMLDKYGSIYLEHCRKKEREEARKEGGRAAEQGFSAQPSPSLCRGALQGGQGSGMSAP